MSIRPRPDTSTSIWSQPRPIHARCRTLFLFIDDRNTPIAASTIPSRFILAHPLIGFATTPCPSKLADSTPWLGPAQGLTAVRKHQEKWTSPKARWLTNCWLCNMQQPTNVLFPAPYSWWRLCDGIYINQPYSCLLTWCAHIERYVTALSNEGRWGPDVKTLVCFAVLYMDPVHFYVV